MEDRRSIHIRSFPFPPVVLLTSWGFNNMFVIEEGLPVPAGTYHRISAGMVGRVEEQAAGSGRDGERRDKLLTIAGIARTFPESEHAEIANPEFSFLGTY